MSKKQKAVTTTISNAVPSIPTMYQGLTRDPSRLKHCVCEDIHGGFYRFLTPQNCHILETSRAKLWANQDAFAAQNSATIAAYHANLFNDEPPKDQDLVTTGVLCWFKICDLSVDRTPSTPHAASGRVAKILNTVYTEGECVEGTADLKTPQAIACCRIFRDAIDAKQKEDAATAEKANMPLPADYVTKLTEEELMTAITNRAGELKTRQNPWRIFQYYRANLIAAKILRRQ